MTALHLLRHLYLALRRRLERHGRCAAAQLDRHEPSLDLRARHY